jgi:dCTP deaminase
MIVPFNERTTEAGMTYGLSAAGYDVRIDQTLSIKPGETALASTMERFHMPNDLLAHVADKSTWARQFLTVQNTIIEPGWAGHLTLELCNHSPLIIAIHRGMPIAQIIFMKLDKPTEQPYVGKYQDQERGAQPARFDDEPLLFAPDVIPAQPWEHSVRQENDEYACSCGRRWDIRDGKEHPQ